MTYWIGDRAAIDAANDAAFAAYIAANPTAQANGQSVPNPTTAWATPVPDAAGTWVIPVYAGMGVPDGCEMVDVPTWDDDLSDL